MNDDLISRQTAIDDIETVNPSMPLNINWVKNWVKTLPPAQPELIERTAYIRGFEQGRTQGMINTQAEHTKKGEKNMIKAEWTNADALNLQLTCNQLATDCISRQDAIDAAIEATDDWDGGYNITRANMIEKELNDLPSAQPVIRGVIDESGRIEFIEQPEPKKGKWIVDGHHIQCNVCHVYMCDTDREGDSIPQNFCPNCGAKMEE